MSEMHIKIIKEKIKQLNPNFQDGALVSDAAFNQIRGLPSEQIEFACRINSAQGVLIGLKDSLVFVEKGNLMTLSTYHQTIKYNDITNILVKSKFIYDKITLIIGRKELGFEIDKRETEYLVKNIEARMEITNVKEICNSFSLNFKLSDIRFEIVGRNFENDFKLVSEKNELYFQRICNHQKEKIQILGNIENVIQVTAENKDSIIKKAGWGILAGAIGGLIAAPVAIAGFFAGIVAKGKSKEICFACELKTGEKFLAKADNEAFQKIIAISML